ncbi:flavin reductase (DIM6/NTAB) family NADH-FMN oxidoreductase RutF [Nicoletella semolina]|uniref:Flavin reductase (DIM6/NTAB) family NADH-FMN oxidoreductase RutF n=1 Tax=Nicoletella semolina TaxID=271160 RepID=A0A4R2N7J2_9PAST|nr:flavin reductase [Nicoletella semolina]MDH2924402.1 hypothetical protein [Nicoletella semolina]TCP16818.1 flavin reductase (DIM6/NTAB) family NADH-FMN oxidoreductase RutF [Nicoletella semolina]
MHQPISPKMFYYGFPVLLLTTVDENGKPNISPLSSSWCLGDNLVIGVGICGKAFENLQRCPEAVVNLPDSSLWQKIEKIASLTAKSSIPDHKKDFYQFCDDKFSYAGFTTQPSLKVKPLRIAECPLQAETTVSNITERDSYAIIELKIQQIHAQSDLISTENKIDPQKWHPLIYNFRSYHGLSESIGKNFRA